MKKKHTYRAKNVNKIDWAQLKARAAGQPLVFAVDVAKGKQYALLDAADGSVSELLHWEHPAQTRRLLDGLESLGCPLEVAVESTGTYGDALRHQFRLLGYEEVFQASAKRVSDAREVYDGVPSLHDAKAATAVARLHRDGVTRPWRESTDQERELDAQRRESGLHQRNHRRNQNRLEGVLARHWPEILGLLPLDSVTLEGLLVEYGSPARLAADPDAAETLRSLSKGKLPDEKIGHIIDSARRTLGQPCLEAERQWIQALAEEMRHARLQQKRSKAALEAAVGADPGLKELGATIGRVTTAVLISCRPGPRHFADARSFQKALGLNLKEKSSGVLQGQPEITKRGCSTARGYLYFAALRLVHADPAIKAWYERKADPRAKNKTVVALMRKLSKALWHVARGGRFDAAKLFPAAA